MIKMQENAILMYKCICVRLHLSTDTCLHQHACITNVETPSTREQRPYLQTAIPCVDKQGGGEGEAVVQAAKHG